jgi:hypothetical protein
MDQAWQVLLAAGAAVSAVTTVCAVGWWLIGPRIRDGVEAAVDRALTRHMADQDRRIRRIEASLHTLLHPSALVELIALLDAVGAHAPPPGLEDTTEIDQVPHRRWSA